MMKSRLSIGFCATAAALATAQPVAAQAQACVASEDLADATTYAMPLLYQAVNTKCSSSLSADGFFAEQGEAFVNRFTPYRDSAWPGAMRVLTTFSNAGKSDDRAMAEMMAALPEEALRPFLDALIVQMVSQEVKIKDCATIEEGVSLLAPLPVENFGKILTFILKRAELDEPKICPDDAG